MSHAYDLRVFGTPSLVARNGTSVRLAPIEMRLTCALALRSPRSCENGWLFDMLWSDGGPRTRATSLQNAVSGVRRATCAEIIETIDHSYRLTDVVAIDRNALRELCTRSEQLLADDAEEAFAIASDLDDLSQDRPWTLLEGSDDARIDAYEAQGERRLAATRVIEALSTTRRDAATHRCEKMIDEDPWDEKLRVLMATSLYRCGRRADSLRSVAAARSVLVEAGLEPGPELIQIESMIASDDARLVSTPKRESRGVPLSGRLTEPFVGRVDALGSLRSVRPSSEESAFSTGLVTGPPGVGKTWLGARLATEQPDVTVLYAPCHEHGSVPLEPLIDALADVKPAEVAALRSLLEHGRGLRSPLGGRIQGAELIPAARISTAVRELAPCLLIVDDVQWVDEATCSALCHLIDIARPTGVGVLAMSRTGAPDRLPLARMYELLARHGMVLELEPFTLDELEDLAVSLTSANNLTSATMEADDVASLHERTGGSPLVASMLLRHRGLAEDGRRHEGPPPELATLVRSQMHQAGRPTADVLRWLSISHRPVSVEVLAILTSSDPFEVLAAVDVASDLGMVVESELGGFELAHTTLRDGIQSEIGRSRIGYMHARFRDALVAVYPTGRWAEIVDHAARAAGPSARTLATRYALEAARDALSRHSPADALRIVDQAVERFSDRGGTDQAGEVAVHVELLVVGAAASVEIDREQCLDFADRALALARRHDLTPQFAQAALARGATWQQGRFDSSTDAALREALVRLGESGDQDLRTQLRANLAGMFAVSGMSSGQDGARLALDWSDRALELIRLESDPAASVSALQARIIALWGRQAYDEQVLLSQRIAALDQDRDGMLVALGLRWEAIPRFCLGHHTRFRECTDRLKRIATATGGQHSLFGGYAEQWSAFDLIIDGEWGRASDLIDSTLGRFTHDDNLLTGALAQSAWIGLETGRSSEWSAAVDQAAAADRGLPSLGVLAALMAAFAGDTESAVDQLKSALPHGVESIPRDIVWTSTIGALSELCVLLDQADLADSLLGVLEGWRGTFIVTAGGLWCYGSAERAIALLQFAAGREADARSSMSAARLLEDRLGAAAVTLRRRAWESRLGMYPAAEVRSVAGRTGQHGVAGILL